MTLGQRIQAGRTALELSQEALGERLGVSRQAVSKWESDAAVPDTDKLIALSRLFGVTLNGLLDVNVGEEAVPPPDTPASGEESGEPGVAGDPPKGPEPGPDTGPLPRKRLFAFALAILLIVALADSRLRIARLEDRIEKLESQVEKSGLELGMGAIYTSCGYGVEENVLLIDVSPKWELDGLEVTFEVIGTDAKNKRVQGEKRENGDYAAEIWLGDLEAPPYTVLAEFSYNSQRRTEPMLRLDRTFGKWVCE